MERKYRLPDVDAVRGCCAGVPEAQGVIATYYRYYLRKCLRSIAVSFHAEINQYDLEDLEQKVIIDTLEVMRPFVAYPMVTKDDDSQEKDVDK